MFEPYEILLILARSGAEFIVVGGMSAVMNGADINTRDLDVVHRRNPVNVSLLLPALRELDAWYRMRTDKKLHPNESYLMSPGHQLLRTIHGDLDLLGAIGVNLSLSYEDLLGDSEFLEIAPGVPVRALSLEKYIELKEDLRRDKDIAFLPTLRATLHEKRKRAAPTPGDNEPE
jgi:hypothetical protein